MRTATLRVLTITGALPPALAGRDHIRNWQNRASFLDVGGTFAPPVRHHRLEAGTMTARR
jgi:hypothetical protein